jgi:ribosome-binding protein aMBF1 (putative translation factor)
VNYFRLSKVDLFCTFESQKGYVVSSDKKNNHQNKKSDSLQEPMTIYGNADGSVLNESQKMNPILEQLIEKSIQDAKEGKGISHEEMMRRIKVKYSFVK